MTPAIRVFLVPAAPNVAYVLFFGMLTGLFFRSVPANFIFVGISAERKDKGMTHSVKMDTSSLMRYLLYGTYSILIGTTRRFILQQKVPYGSELLKFMF
jgi:hypothetical protein